MLDLHNAIMNIQATPGMLADEYVSAYKMGHKDARHAAAELAATHAGAAERVTPAMVEQLAGATAEAEAIDGNLKAIRSRLDELTSAPAEPVARDPECEYIDELIFKLECFIDHATGGKLSKSSWALETLKAAHDEHVKAREDAAVAELAETPPAAGTIDARGQEVRTLIGYTWTQANGKHRSIGAAPHPTNAHNIEPIYYSLTSTATEMRVAAVDLATRTLPKATQAQRKAQADAIARVRDAALVASNPDSSECRLGCPTGSCELELRGQSYACPNMAIAALASRHEAPAAAGAALAVAKTDKQWLEFCRPYVYMNGSHEMPDYAAICRAVVSLTQAKGTDDMIAAFNKVSGMQWQSPMNTEEKIWRKAWLAALAATPAPEAGETMRLLRKTEYFVSTYANRNPKHEYEGRMQDPSGVHALLAEIRAALKAAQPVEREDGK